MARALMTDPSMVMLDEPMAGVNPALTQSLLQHVKDLPSFGKTVLFVEHDMDVVMDISDWVIVMGQGRIIAEGPPRVVAENPDVIDAYLGQEHGDEARFTPVPRAGVPAAEDRVVEVAPVREDEGLDELGGGRPDSQEGPS
jgi:ABC-type transporter Mla maintaining outer membrane lipid asymmetry ATPase subunit MlaF